MQVFRIYKALHPCNIFSFGSAPIFQSKLKQTLIDINPKIPLSPKKLAQQLKVSQSQIRKQMVNPRAIKLDKSQVQMISLINGYKIRFQGEKTKVQEKSCLKKCPVITVMGHVDHGKTTLIDFLRKSNIAQKQEGGITQKIGAFSIDMLGDGNKITFIDTPGHQAFKNMRQRGATITDLVVLIVSATQGVKKQTLQIIDILKKDNIRTIVAINKLDLPEANPEEVQEQLFKAGLQLETHGGNIPVVHISAKNGKNVGLLCQLIKQETQNLEADHKCMVESAVLEAYQNSEGFNSCTLIVQKGVLKMGSIVVFGENVAKIKNMQDDMGNPVLQAFPGDAVQIIGIPNIPNAGDYVFQVQSQNKAKFIIEKRKQIMQQEKSKSKQDSSLSATKIELKGRRERRKFAKGLTEVWNSKFEEAEQKIVGKIQKLQSNEQQTEEVKEELEQALRELKNHKEYVYQYIDNTGISHNAFNLIFKFADRGIQQTILQQFTKVKAKIESQIGYSVTLLKTEVGQVTLSDIEDAALLEAQVFTFGVGIKAQAIPAIKKHNIQPKNHKLIHNFLADIKRVAQNRKKLKVAALTQKGKATILQVYNFKKGKGQSYFVAGVKIADGKINKTNKLFIYRNDVPVSEATLASTIKVFKKQVNEVKKNDECTIILKDQSILFEKGDEIRAFQ